MSNDTVVSLTPPALVPDPLTELLRSGARRLVEAAVRAELEEHLSTFGHEKLPDGRPRREAARAPPSRSTPQVAPPYVRRCASLDATIPWLYLHGVSTGQ